MTDAQTQGLLAIDASEDAVLYACAYAQNDRNLNATVATTLRKLGLIRPAPEWLAHRGVGIARAWVLTDAGCEAIERIRGSLADDPDEKLFWRTT